MAISSTDKGISIIMPAFRAETTIARAVASVLRQTASNWEVLLIADDGSDYETIIGRAGIADKRIRYLATGRTGSGSSPTRNLGLDAARFRYAATLDADDMMAPEKLALTSTLLETHGIVSTALRVESAQGRFLRTVGVGPDQILDPGRYKFVNLSMDSMIAFDRAKADPRYNPDFPCLTDIEFLLRLFEKNETVFHLGAPLHIYTKQSASISNKPDAGAAMIATKRRLIAAIEASAYPLAMPEDQDGLLRFYRTSLAAEQSYGARLADTPGLLFEDHLEPMLRAN